MSEPEAGGEHEGDGAPPAGEGAEGEQPQTENASTEPDGNGEAGGEPAVDGGEAAGDGAEVAGDAAAPAPVEPVVSKPPAPAKVEEPRASDEQLRAWFDAAAKKIKDSQKGAVVDYQVAEKNLLRSFDLGERSQIMALAQRHAQVKAKRDAVVAGVRLVGLIRPRLAELLSDKAGRDLEKHYSALAAQRQPLDIPELNDFVRNRRPVGCEEVVVEEINEKTISGYVRGVMEGKGTKVSAAERLRVLFPPARVKPVLPSANRGME